MDCYCPVHIQQIVLCPSNRKDNKKRKKQERKRTEKLGTRKSLTGMAKINANSDGIGDEGGEM